MADTASYSGAMKPVIAGAAKRSIKGKKKPRVPLAITSAAKAGVMPVVTPKSKKGAAKYSKGGGRPD